MGAQGKRVISSTTDGFLTDDDTVYKFNKADFLSRDLIFSAQFAEYREMLGFSPTALDKKLDELVGVISIKTRGQLGMGSGFSSLTGISSKQSIPGLREILKEKITGSDTNKTIIFSSNRLTGAVDTLKKGGHVTMVPVEKAYNVTFDNRRAVNTKPEVTPLGIYYETKPHLSVREIQFVKGLSKLHEATHSTKHP